jgi:hypothetical protein
MVYLSRRYNCKNTDIIEQILKYKENVKVNERNRKFYNRWVPQDFTFNKE